MAIIKNYGFLWERKYIYVGRGGGGQAGHLKGFRKGLQNQKVDFRTQIGVYVLYDKDQNIIYVGQAGNGRATLFSRLKAHMKDSLWNRWVYFTWLGFRKVNANGSLANVFTNSNALIGGYRYRHALNEFEGILIEVIEPKLNKQSGKLKAAHEYFQLIDPGFSNDQVLPSD